MTRLGQWSLEALAERVATLIPRRVYLDEPLTHPDFNGDSFSTVAVSTKIENTGWSRPIPSNAQALLVRVVARDEGVSVQTDPFFAVGPSSAEWSCLAVHAIGDDAWCENLAWIPCTEGDLYYRVTASGADTLDVYLQVWGWEV